MTHDIVDQRGALALLSLFGPADAAPDAIKATREFAAICPASAVLMTKQLRET